MSSPSEFSIADAPSAADISSAFDQAMAEQGLALPATSPEKIREPMGIPDPEPIADTPSGDDVSRAYEQAIAEQRLAPARDGAAMGTQFDPKRQARIAEVRSKTGLPEVFVENNLEERERSLIVEQIPWEDVERSPSMQTLLAKPGDAAMFAPSVLPSLKIRDILGDAAFDVDESEALARGRLTGTGREGEDFTTTIGKAFTRGKQSSFDAPAAGWPIVWHAANLGPSPTIEQKRKWETHLLNEVGPLDPGPIGSIFAPAAEQLPNIWNQVLFRTTFGASGGLIVGGVTGAAALATGPGAVPAAIAGFGTGAVIAQQIGGFVAGFRTETINVFKEYSLLVDVEGRPIPQDVAAHASLVVGAINGAADSFGLGLAFKLARGIPGAGKALSKGTGFFKNWLKNKLKNPANWSAIRSWTVPVMKAVGIETGVEMGQQGVQIGGRRQLRGVPLTEPPTREEVAEVVGAGKEAALATGVLGFGVQGAARANRSFQNRSKLRAARKIAETMELQKTAPSQFRELTQSMAEEKGIKTVGLQADKLIELYEAEGLTREDMINDAPEIENQLDEALETGGEVTVSFGRYLEIYGPRFGEDMEPYTRLGDGDLTPIEAEQIEARMDEIEAEAANPAEFSEAGVLAEQAERDLGLRTPLFLTQDESGTDGATWANYQDTREKSRLRVVEDLKKDNERLQRERTREQRQNVSAWNRHKRGVTKVVKETVESRPVYQADARLRKRPVEGSPHRFDRELFSRLYGPKVLASLPSSYFQRGGLHPDFLAEGFGYPSGLDLIRDLLKADRKAEIAAGVDAEMVLEFGDVEVPTVDMAWDAASNDANMEALAIEERILRKRGTRDTPVSPQQVLKDRAEELVQQTPVSQLRPSSYRDAAARQDREAVEAFRQGDFDTAATLRQQQRLNILRERAARAAKLRIQINSNFIKSLGNRTMRERIALGCPSCWSQIEQTLERFGLKEAPGQEILDERATLQEFIDAQFDLAETILAPRWMTRTTESPKFNDLTVRQQQEVRNMLENISHVARGNLQIKTVSDEADAAGAASSVIRSILQAFPNMLTRRKDAAVITRVDKIRRWLRSADSSLAKAEAIIDELSNKDPNSVLRRLVFEPLALAEQARIKMLGWYARRLREAHNDRGKGEIKRGKTQIQSDFITHPDGTLLTYDEVDILAMNMLNKGNRKAVLAGLDIKEEQVWQVEAFLNAHMSDASKVYVQKVLNLMGSLWPQVRDLEKKMTGLTPEKVEGARLPAVFGDFEGGYMPIVHDRDSTQADFENALDSTPLPMGMTNSGTAHPHTQARKGAVGAPIKLRTSVVRQHMEQVILDLTHREAWVNARKFLRREDVDGAIKAALGEEFGFRRFWDLWLRDIARNAQDTRQLGIWERGIRHLRRLATVGVLVFRATTLIIQVSGHFGGARLLQKRLGAKAGTAYWAKGNLTALGLDGRENLFEARYRVAIDSDFMDQRLQNADREIRETMGSDFEADGVIESIANFGMRLIVLVQLHSVDIPIWLGAYQGAIDKLGMDHDRAVQFADSMVRESQAAASIIDLSRFQRGGRNRNEFVKSISMFYSFNNAMYQRLRKLGKIRRLPDLPSAFADYAMFFIGPGLFSQIMRATVTGGFPDPGTDEGDDKWIDIAVQSMAGEAMSAIPVLREANQAVRGFTVESGPIGQALGEVRDLRKAIDSGEGEDIILGVVKFGGFFLGIPISPIDQYQTIKRNAERYN